VPEPGQRGAPGRVRGGGGCCCGLVQDPGRLRSPGDPGPGRRSARGRWHPSPTWPRPRPLPSPLVSPPSRDFVSSHAPPTPPPASSPALPTL
jgi:hypothetical protein